MPNSCSGILQALLRTTPLSVLDQQFLPWDQSEPLCILFELRVEGRLSAERVVDALRTAIAHHPMARSRLASFGRLHLAQCWEILDEVQDIPLEVVECAQDGAFNDARSRLLSRAIDLRTAPPFALMLAHRAGGDSLCMSLSHAAGDGVSAFRLMRSIACAYAGVEDVIDGPDPLAVRDLSFYPGSSSSAARIRQLLKILNLRRHDEPDGPMTRLVTQPGEAPTSDAGFRDFHFVHLDQHETTAVLAQRRAPATINDLLIASLALAVRRWNHAHGVASSRINVLVALNLRGSAWSTEVVSNFAKDLNVAIPESAQHSLLDAQLAVAEQTRIIKRRRAAGEIDLVGPLNVVPRRLRSPAVTRLQKRPNRANTIGLSNLGAVDSLPDLDNDAGRVTELWFGPPGIMSFGTLAGVLTLGGEMFLALHYRKSQLTRTAAEAFAETWRRVLWDRV